MQISVTDAKAQLTDLVRRAEAGDEIILTRHGQPTVRLVAVRKTPNAEAKRKVLEEVWSAGRARASEGPNAERSQDYLYDESGLPK